jgi:hypothetical protein
LLLLEHPAIATNPMASTPPQIVREEIMASSARSVSLDSMAEVG